MSKEDQIVVHLHQLSDVPLRMSGSLSGEVFGIKEADRLTMDSPINYNLTAQLISDDQLLVQGKASTEADCFCDRCGKPFVYELACDDICHYVEEVHQEDIDLTDEIREELVLALPAKFLCQDDCAGICPSCNKNLNDHACDCEAPASAPSVWDKLDEL
ncbi:MAG: DUF177 domain-containing protein [Lentisphaeria bacterium]|nr:DUF177 domain-containing protein [Lentisphaeria bacterium]